MRPRAPGGDQQAPYRRQRTGNANGKWPLVVGASQRATCLRLVHRPRHIVGERGTMLQGEISRRRIPQRAAAAERGQRQDDQGRITSLQRRDTEVACVGPR